MESYYEEEYQAATPLIASILWGNQSERNQLVTQLDTLNNQISTKNTALNLPPDDGLIITPAFSIAADLLSEASMQLLDSGETAKFFEVKKYINSTIDAYQFPSIWKITWNEFLDYHSLHTGDDIERLKKSNPVKAVHDAREALSPKQLFNTGLQDKRFSEHSTKKESSEGEWFRGELPEEESLEKASGGESERESSGEGSSEQESSEQESERKLSNEESSEGESSEGESSEEDSSEDESEGESSEGESSEEDSSEDESEGESSNEEFSEGESSEEELSEDESEGELFNEESSERELSEEESEEGSEEEDLEEEDLEEEEPRQTYKFWQQSVPLGSARQNAQREFKFLLTKGFVLGSPSDHIVIVGFTCQGFHTARIRPKERYEDQLGGPFTVSSREALIDGVGLVAWDTGASSDTVAAIFPKEDASYPPTFIWIKWENGEWTWESRDVLKTILKDLTSYEVDLLIYHLAISQEANFQEKLCGKRPCFPYPRM
ncbi:hypothetical protein N7533_000730 [Penicillium manginii]|uniref:uncharacterized protein n=1 Tax=Penicillium manginii TaxID=203109 RepID=UPI00254728E1|nr:uncharacterized protein N7533_000730 [Penicillium manginii]KAJ5768147.1 hypothetical protein N7533_000730 [Penicillium manginii]